ncbi:hypothetical protein G9H61_04130 [Aquirufa ecclesiirivi]|uniref:Paeninodin family lasso peptide n=1 Tax=Aquirufa ecclesiirivi TaxID=2715124 RepID=A0ABT4JEC0_9BACT|nr:hypothetical protein [Aquirufa ecclesiirivi]MCZ2474619.1 hypothetical protein [Aquirufa ecclesiirivi]
MEYQELNITQNNVVPDKKTWESPEIVKWDLDKNLSLKGGAKNDGSFSTLS